MSQNIFKGTYASNKRICRDCEEAKDHIYSRTGGDGKEIYVDANGHMWRFGRCYPCHEARYYRNKASLVTPEAGAVSSLKSGMVYDKEEDVEKYFKNKRIVERKCECGKPTMKTSYFNCGRCMNYLAKSGKMGIDDTYNFHDPRHQNGFRRGER